MAQGEQCRLVNKVLHVLWIAYFYSTCFELVLTHVHYTRG